MGSGCSLDRKTRGETGVGGRCTGRELPYGSHPMQLGQPKRPFQLFFLFHIPSQFPPAISMPYWHGFQFPLLLHHLGLDWTSFFSQKKRPPNICIRHMAYTHMYPTYVYLHGPSSQLMFLNPSTVKKYLNDLRIFTTNFNEKLSQTLVRTYEWASIPLSFSNLAECWTGSSPLCERPKGLP